MTPPPDAEAVDERQKGLIRRIQLLLDRAVRGEVTGIVYVQQLANGDVFEGMQGSINAGRVSDSLRDLWLDINNRHSEKLSKG